MRSISIEERRARLGRRHRLAGTASTGSTGSAGGPVEAADAVIALHATDPATVFLSVAARTGPVGPASVDDVEKALYADRTLVRMLAMRRTMFVVPTATAPVLQASCTRAVAAQQRRRYTQLIEAAGLGDGAWLKDVEESTARALAARGEATGAELAADEPRLRSRVRMAEGKSYGGEQNITTWVLLLLAADGRIVRGRPRGSWTSTQWRWAPVESWLPGGMPEPAVEDARAELVRRWLAAFGPGTVADLRRWTGWAARDVKAALTRVRPAEVDLDGQTGLVLADDVEPTTAPEPWVAFLPALDPTAMGWSERSWYVGAHRSALFDRSGNIGPTVWADGRVVGGWAQRPDGEVTYRLLEDVGSATARTVEEHAERMHAWLGSTRVVPRFRTPLEKELSR
ncbi:winged helix DNA-binding domain-containing protein [Actinopolymorpha singaporensis]|uniref:Winged helix DNA-binding domain-containing protein n=1 Tax=Actinopolymorpha singaporensis TaxID=117157 RepID=A0A1H1WPG0_9ACTN|nr:winged helix DNA-binding domain-containing protein [Actinopolymorpha singaporensis]SDS98521.1 Winged helix DNA-binding domain-containing protein [Actinopolymorpha singaporensis]